MKITSKDNRVTDHAAARAATDKVMREGDLARAVATRQRSYPTGAAGIQQLRSDMAAIMVDRHNANGNCTEAELLQAGFTAEEIAAQGQKAAEKARRLCRDVCLRAA